MVRRSSAVLAKEQRQDGGQEARLPNAALDENQTPGRKQVAQDAFNRLGASGQEGSAFSQGRSDGS